MTWISIKKILAQKIITLKLGDAMSLRRLRKDWDEILGNALGGEWQGETKPVKLKNKILVIICKNSVWANELRLKEKILLKEIHSRVREIVIEKIKLVS